MNAICHSIHHLKTSPPSTTSPSENHHHIWRRTNLLYNLTWTFIASNPRHDQNLCFHFHPNDLTTTKRAFSPLSLLTHWLWAQLRNATAMQHNSNAREHTKPSESLALEARAATRTRGNPASGMIDAHITLFLRF